MHAPTNLVDLLEERAKAAPERQLYSFLLDGEAEEAHLNCGQLRSRARAIANELRKKVKPGERAVLLYPPGLDYIEAFFGCLHAGVIAVPAYPPNPSALERTLPRLISMMENAEAALVLTTAQIEPLARQFMEGIPVFDRAQWVATDSIPDSAGEGWAAPEVSGESLAFLQYTSGSTHTPKGVMISHGNLIYNSGLIYEAFGHSEHSKGVIWLPPYHDMGLIGGILQPLYGHRPVVLMSPLDFLQRPMRWLEAISRFRATTSGGPNFAYDLCVKKTTPESRASLDLSCWEVAFNGAEPIRSETLDRFTEAFAPCGFRREAFYPCYGLAEATLIASGGKPGVAPRIRGFEKKALAANRAVLKDGADTLQLVGCGRKLSPVETLLVVDPESGRPLPDDAIGEIWLAGPSIGKGYFNQREETARAFQAHGVAGGPFLRTGDLGFIHDDDLFVTGRSKDLIIVRGRNHYPQDLERTVEACHPGLRPGCGAAFALDVDGQEAVGIAYELDTAFFGEADALMVKIRRAVIEAHELPVHALVLVKPKTIPKTSSGKIQRSACRAAFLAGEYGVAAPPPRVEAPVAAPAPAIVGPNEAAIRERLIAEISAVTGLEVGKLDPRLPFAHFGMTSVQMVSLTGTLETWLGRRLAPILAYEYPSIEQLARHLGGQGAPVPPPQKCDPVPEPIAIVGIGCRFPGADGPRAFWDLLREGVDAVGKLPAERTALVPSMERLGKVYPWGAFLGGIEQFDPAFFHLSMREAVAVDPQQRLLLELAWEALGDAGQPVEALSGTPAGVFLGISTGDYSRLPFQSDPHALTGNAFSIAANRVSYALDLRGPSMAIDTACSSSLVAVHLACESLWSGESSLALAGGVNLILSSEITESLSKTGFLAPDGKCKTFDASANGYVRGEGAGLVVLKPLSKALAAGDRVYAVIRGSAVNNGGRNNGLTAPSVKGQQAVVRRAYQRAQVPAGETQYVELHGTGTVLGDPIEATALGTVLSEGRKQPCRIGSVKTNIGHLEAAAGIAGLIKAALALTHRQLPGSLHFKDANPNIALAPLGLALQQKTEAWPEGPGTRRAGVSSFGFGGTNAHVVLEEAPASLARAPDAPVVAPPAWSRVRCWPRTEYRNDAPLVHPLLGRSVPLAQGQVWENVLDTRTQPYLGDHRLNGAAIVPASAFLEMGLAAAAPRALKDLKIRRPLRVDAPQLTQVAFEGGREVFNIYARPLADPTAAWSLCAGGTVVPLGEAPTGLELAELKRRCAEPIAVADHRQALAARGFTHGPSFRGLLALWRGKEEVLGRVQLPDVLATEQADYQFHPAFLDACAQIVSVLDPAGRSFVPVGALRVEQWRRPGAQAWSYARKSESLADAIDLWVFDDAGAVVAQVTGLQLQFLDAVNLPTEHGTYELRWDPRPNAITAQRTTPSTWVILTDRGGVGAQLAARLTARGDRCVIVDPTRQADLAKVFAEARPDGVLHLWSLDTDAVLSVADLERGQTLGASSALFAFQQIAKVKQTRPPRLWLVTRGTQPVESSRLSPSPAASTLWGLGRTLAQEHRECWGGLIDLPTDEDPAKDSQLLEQELGAADGEQQVALRKQRYVARLVRAPKLPAAAELRADGTYLITGALGATGLLVAEGLVERGARRLILMGRTALPPRSQWKTLDPRSRVAEQIAVIQRLESRGVSVHLAAVDVGVEADLAAFLTRFREEAWPPIRGVVHLAGVLQDRTLLNLDAAALGEVFRAKVGGAWLLHRLLARDPLDFFTMFSSVASVLGSAGQGNYAAANAFLDGLAHQRHAQGLPALSINWGPWAELGLATGSAERLARGGITALDPRHGVELFQQLLGAPQAQLTVLDADWAQLSTLLGRPPLLSELSTLPKSEPQARVAVRHDLIALGAEARTKVLVELLVERIGVALGSTSPVSPDLALDRMGLDSLMGIELRAQLENELGIRVDMGLLLSGPTIVELAASLSGLIERGSSVEPVETERAPTVTPIQPAGSRPPFFCVHPGALNVSIYATLSKLLGPDQPFYSLSPRELEASYTPAADALASTSIERLAERCIQSLKQTQPKGPYLLGGWSLGGVLAFEMARQLRSEGAEVALLALFDSPSPIAPPSAPEDIALVPAFASYLGVRHGVEFPVPSLDWKPLSLDQRLDAVLEWGKKNALFPSSHELAQLRPLFSGYRQGLRYAVSHLVDYRPEVYAGRIIYFRATRQLEAYEGAFPQTATGWSAWTSQPLELVDVVGDHYNMFVAPQVQTLAAQFGRFLHGEARPSV